MDNVNQLPQDWDANFVSRARAVGIRSDRGWPYGLNHRGASVKDRARMVEWAEVNGLKLSKGNCLHWLHSGRCTSYEGHRYSRWYDHPTGWNIDGKPALLLCQPYDFDDDAIMELARIAEQGYEIDIGTDGWYGHGTVTVEIWIPDQRRKSWRVREQWHDAKRAAEGGRRGGGAHA